MMIYYYSCICILNTHTHTYVYQCMAIIDAQPRCEASPGVLHMEVLARRALSATRRNDQRVTMRGFRVATDTAGWAVGRTQLVGGFNMFQHTTWVCLKIVYP